MNWDSLTSEQLIRACIDSADAPAWEEFVRRFRPVIARTVLRTARRFGVTAPNLIDDLIQETYLKICGDRCRILREFRSEDSDAIFGLLKTVAFSVTQDHFKRAWTIKRGSGEKETAIDSFIESVIVGDEGVSHVEQAILLREIDDYLRSESHTVSGERDRQIFWLHHRHGMTARAIALIPGIGLTQKGVESVIQRVTNQVRCWLVEKRQARTEGKSSANSL